MSGLTDDLAAPAALGWALGCYAFDRYRTADDEVARLVWPP